MGADTQAIEVTTQGWQWQSWSIRYQQAGQAGTPVLLIHGFGASSDHWRRNLATLATRHRVFAIDLLGFGNSAKPKPHQDVEYCFETWATQVLDFCQEVVGESAYLVGNSIGCIVALQAAAINPEAVRGIVMLNCSLRLLHERKRATQPLLSRWFTPWVQKVLGVKPIGHQFFKSLARSQTLRKVLLQAYARKEAVTDELIDLLLKPAQDAGAADVFLAFIQYSSGPLAEDLLPILKCPVHILWGKEDPWEPVTLGENMFNYPCVQSFEILDGVGHCPQDEAPEVVNPLLLDKFQQMDQPTDQTHLCS